MEELKESVWSGVWQKNESQDEGKGLQDDSKTSNGVRSGDMGGEEGAWEEDGGHRNEYVTMDMRCH